MADPLSPDNEISITENTSAAALVEQGLPAWVGATGSYQLIGNVQSGHINSSLSNVPDPIPGPRLMLSNHPNPFNPMTTISFDLAKAAAVSLRVFDVSGRLVRVLVDGETVAEGRQEAVWNGRDDSGRRVASGTYFYRLEAGGYSETKRMALIK